VDKRLAERTEVLREIASLIRRHPSHVIDALTASKAFFESTDKKGLADAAAYALNNNRNFQKNIAVVIAKDRLGYFDKGLGLDASDFYYGSGINIGAEAKESGVTIGTAVAGGAQAGGVWGAIAGAVIGVIDAGFQWAGAGREAKIQEVKDREEMYKDLFPDEKKKNKLLAPALILGGVFIVGGIVTWLALNKKI
jgi:hypothetical protein